MTRMLASVIDAEEADIALRFGADIIDLKDPANGTLGAVDLEIARRALASVARRRETSAALGDPPYAETALNARARALASMGVDYLKLAVDRQTLARLRESLTALARETALVGMMFADEAPDFGLISDLADMGFKGAMLDTRDKSAGRLLTQLDIVRLGEFGAHCRAAELIWGLAGSLEAPDVPRLMLLGPDVLGFRGALCRDHSRINAIDPQSVALIRDLIPRERSDIDAWGKVDWRLLGRGIVGGREQDDEVDCVYVRNFVLPADIGAYDYERGAPQRVVFDVEATVRRGGPHSDDMRAIFSYDVILDAIRLVVGRGHFEFVETLAEEVAALVLRHARVRSVRINVSKLDVVDGAVGVEIRRERAAASANERPLDIISKSTTSTD